jgi:hypothetical protein
MDPLYVAVQLQRLADLGLKPELIEEHLADRTIPTPNG